MFFPALHYNKETNKQEVIMKQKFAFLLALMLSFTLIAGCAVPAETTEPVQAEIVLTEPAAAETEAAETEAIETTEAETEPWLDPYGSYTTKEDVALYIHLYEELPLNFMTKKQAKALGWEGGSLEPVAPGMCIGGDYFGNYEGLLPEDREYTECDIDTLGASKRGAKRIVFSDDGLIYYTEDHYESFELLYGEP